MLLYEYHRYCLITTHVNLFLQKFTLLYSCQWLLVCKRHFMNILMTPRILENIYIKIFILFYHLWYNYATILIQYRFLFFMLHKSPLPPLWIYQKSLIHVKIITQMSDVVYRSLVNFRFKVELVEGHVYEEYPEVVMRPKYGIKIKVKQRWSSVCQMYLYKEDVLIYVQQAASSEPRV